MKMTYSLTMRRVVSCKFADFSKVRIASIIRAMMAPLKRFTFLRVTRRNIPQGCHIHNPARKNLKVTHGVSKFLRNVCICLQDRPAL
jgi:hypothetical protein